ncbi:ribonuclease D [Vibrio stylophorae]|nr:ribonuclease D [Vibrio stylophorae]
MNYQMITDSQGLATVCEAAAQVPAVMLDTEFVRTRTLYPQLGLIQLFDGQTLSLIDPLSIEDMSPLWQLLVNPQVIKVLHACSEDLEVFLRAGGVLPAPMYDTQVMAAFLGHGLSTGFAKLVEEYLGVTLDKGESRTDWLARPLTDKQLNYAAADVHYLWPLYHTLAEKLAQTPWQQAMIEECERLVAKKNKVIRPELAYLDIKGAWQLKPYQLAVLQKLAQWRLEQAQKRDLALNFVVKEAQLLDLARDMPMNQAQLESLALDPFVLRRYSQILLRLIRQGKAVSPDAQPEALKRLVDEPAYKAVLKSFKPEIEKLSQQTGLASEFIASKKQIHQVLKWVWWYDCDEAKRPDMLKSWRGLLLNSVVQRIFPQIKL